MPKVDLDKSMIENIAAFSEGNPGALSVLTQLALLKEPIDPKDWLGQYGPIIAMDNLDIHASRIWMLYKDVCGEDLETLVWLLRANQLGYFSTEALNLAIDTGDRTGVYDAAKKASVRILGE